MPADQAPYYYRFKLGDAEATIVSDGILPLGDPNGSFLGLTKDLASLECDRITGCSLCSAICR